MDLCLIPCLEKTFVLQTSAAFQWPKCLSSISRGTVLQNYDVSPERQHVYSLAFIKHAECISSI